jgi:phenylalanyl-tRNA synthetase beta chain
LIFKRADNPVLHNNVSAYIYQGSQMIGWIGKVHPRIDSNQYWCAEINLNNLEINSEVIFKDYDANQLNKIDINYSLEKEEELLNKIDINIIDKINFYKIIDEYQKDDKKIITVRFYGNNKVIDSLK